MVVQCAMTRCKGKSRPCARQNGWRTSGTPTSLGYELSVSIEHICDGGWSYRAVSADITVPYVEYFSQLILDVNTLQW